MITKFKLFEKSEIDEKTIRVDGGERGWYIDFYFDDENRLIGADNKWNVKFPDWWGLKPTIIEIAVWAKKYDPKIIVGKQVYYILKNAEQKYNI